MDRERLPETLGEYTVDRRIGGGSAGHVLEVRHRRTGAVHAAKLILESRGGTARERFRREAELLARCEPHPGIVKIHAFGETAAGVPFLVMDLVPGENLERLLDREGPLAPARAATLCRDLADALGHAHALGIVHRDVKPSNVLIDRSGRPKLGDFGIALARDLQGLTQTGAFLGTPSYVAPEQVGESRVGPAADVFSVGCILFQAIAGRTPFEGIPTVAELFQELASARPMPDVLLHAPDCPPRLAAIVARALAKSPLARYETGRDLAAALDAWLRGDGSLPDTEGAGLAPSSAPLRPATPSPDPSASRQTIGAYVLESTLGAGGVGTVYRARALDGRPVALKLLGRSATPNLARFQREVRLQGALGAEEGFVPLLDAGESPAGPYIVMPLLEGGTLRDRILKGGPLAPAEAVALVGAVARSLGRAHERGIVHRDLKPENILFDAEGRPHVADLGLAKHFRLDVTGGSLSAALSESGGFRGTAGYLAPEQMEDASSVGPAADVFALGVTLYELLTGVQPFGGGGLLEILARAARGEYEPIEVRCPKAPRWLRTVVARALSRDPSFRFADGHALADALGASRPVRTRRVSRVLIAALAAAVVLATLGGARVLEARRDAAVAALCSSGHIALRRGESDAALAAYDRAIETDPRAALAYAGRSEVHLKAGRLDRALDDAARAVALGPLLAATWDARASARAAKADHDGAIDDATRGLELEPDRVHCLETRGMSRYERNDWRGSILDYTRLLEVRRTPHAVYWANRGASRAVLGDHAGAVSDLDWSLDLDPRQMSAWANRGFSKTMLGDVDGAIADETRALELAPRSAAALVNRARSRIHGGDLPAAIEDCTRAIELAPRNLDALGFRARARALSGDRAGALEDLGEILRLSPQDAKAAFDRAILREQAGDFTGAGHDYNRTITSGSGRSPLAQTVGWRRKGPADWRAPVPVDASQRLARLAASASPPAREVLARALLDAAQGGDATAGFEAAVAAAPQDKTVLLARARWLVGHEKLDEARTAIEEARAAGVDRFTLARLNGDRLWRRGKTRDAAAVFKDLAHDDADGPAGTYALAALALLAEDFPAGLRHRLDAAIAKPDAPPEIFRIYAHGMLLADLEQLWPERIGIAAGYANRAIELEGLLDVEPYFVRELAIVLLYQRIDPNPAPWINLRFRMNELVPGSPRYAYLLGRATLTWGDLPLRALDAETERRAVECFDEAAAAADRGLGDLGHGLLELRRGLHRPPGETWRVTAAAREAGVKRLLAARARESGCWIPRWWIYRLGADAGVVGQTRDFEMGSLANALQDPAFRTLGPTRTRALEQRALARGWRGDHKGAVDDYTKVIELEPRNSYAWNGRGWWRAHLGDTAGAIADCNKAMELTPGDGSHHHTRGMARAKQGDLVGALEDLDRAVALTPSANVLRERGRVRDRAGDAKGALADLEAYLALERDLKSKDATEVRARVDELRKRAG